MTAWKMSPELRKQLRDGIDGEGWVDGYKLEMREAIDAYGDGDEIHYDEEAAAEDDLERFAPVASLIEYFGLEYIAEHGELPHPVVSKKIVSGRSSTWPAAREYAVVTTFTTFCLCSVPKLNERQVCTKCHTQWEE